MQLDQMKIMITITQSLLHSFKLIVHVQLPYHIRFFTNPHSGERMKLIPAITKPMGLPFTGEREKEKKKKDRKKNYKSSITMFA